MSVFKDLAGPMRLPFLILTPACLLPGIVTASLAGSRPGLGELVLLLLGATCAHVGVNAFNEYFDFKSGLDSKTSRTPFSGGSGTLQKNPKAGKSVLFMASTATLISVFVGLYFVITETVILLIAGIIGVAVVVLYSIFIVRSSILCLLAPGVGFGFCMVLGTNLALTGSVTWPAVVASLVPFFLVNNLLHLNQIPDVDADRSVGRRTFPIVYGIKSSVIVCALFYLFAFVSVAIGIALNQLPVLSLLCYIAIPGAAVAAVGAWKYVKGNTALVPSLGMNVMVTLVTPVLLGVGIFLGH